MATFILTARTNIPLGNGLAPIHQREQRIINIGTYGITEGTLFTNFQCKDILAQQLNLAFGTGNFFTRDNLLKFAGYFKVIAV